MTQRQGQFGVCCRTRDNNTGSTVVSLRCLGNRSVTECCASALGASRGAVADKTAAESAFLQTKYKEFAKTHTQSWARSTHDEEAGSATSKYIYDQYRTVMLKIQKTLSSGEKIIKLEETRPRKVIVLEGETQYCWVDSAKRPAPLRISVETLEGCFEAFVSSRTAKPSKMNCEMCCNPETAVKVEDAENRKNYFFPCRYKTFQAKCIYMGIVASKHAVLRIDIKFGCRCPGTILYDAHGVDMKPMEENRTHYETQSIISRINSQIKLLRSNQGMFRALQTEVGILFEIPRLSPAQTEEGGVDSCPRHQPREQG